MSKVITMTLDPSSIDAAIDQLRAYEMRLTLKCQELSERLALFIAKDASAVFNSAVAEDRMAEGIVTGWVEVTVENHGTMTIVIASGHDAVFMEFGAGVYYNGSVGTSPNPLGEQLGFTIGSYGKGNGAKEVWAYEDGAGQLHLTHGTPASMPLYRAVQSVSRDIVRIAREVFST